jgi:group II intron reverse transcriptase/maturase
MAVVLIIGAVFEVDLLPEQFAYRPGRDAKAAVRRVFFQVTQDGRREVVDADLSDYFNTIPHGPLIRCLSRRISDGRVLSVIRMWLRSPVEERSEKGLKRTTEARDRGRGTPQGGVISPLLANLYFRRFLLAWERFGIGRRLDATISNYADDFVICCRPGNGVAAMKEMRGLMARLGLTVNEDKTRLVRVPEESFDFLGYTLGRFHGRAGKPYIGTRPSKKAIVRLRREIHDATSSRWNYMPPQERVERLNRMLRGWTGYFNQGPVLSVYRLIEDYTLKRFRRWLMRRRGQRGTGYRQYPDEYLFKTLGLFKLPRKPSDLANAKAGGTG